MAVGLHKFKRPSKIFQKKKRKRLLSDSVYLLFFFFYSDYNARGDDFEVCMPHGLERGNGIALARQNDCEDPPASSINCRRRCSIFFFLLAAAALRQGLTRHRVRRDRHRLRDGGPHDGEPARGSGPARRRAGEVKIGFSLFFSSFSFVVVRPRKKKKLNVSPLLPDLFQSQKTATSSPGAPGGTSSATTAKLPTTSEPR